MINSIFTFSLNNTAIKKLETTNQLLIAALCWASLQPFYLWTTYREACGIILFLAMTITFFCYIKGNYRLDTNLKAPAFILVSFLLWITLMPTHNGGNKPWLTLAPVIFVLTSMNQESRKKTLFIFTWMLTLSVIPQIFSLIFGNLFSTNFTYMIKESFEPIKQNAGVFYFTNHLSAFLNTVTFPLNGSFFYVDQPHINTPIWTRLTGPFPEPGLLGSISILILATLQRKRSLLHFLVSLIGLFTFSMAFFASFPVLLWANIKNLKPYLLSLGIFVLFLAVLPALGGYGFLRAMLYERLYLYKTTDAIYETAYLPFLSESDRIAFDDINGKYIGFNKNQRESRACKDLGNNFLKSPLMAKTLGISTDAVSIVGDDCQTWKLYFYNYGLVGFAIICCFFVSLFKTFKMDTKTTIWLLLLFCS